MIDATKIRHDMPIVDARGNHVGTVDRLNRHDEIRLARAGSPDGLHHYIPLDWVGAVDHSVHLKMASSQVLRERD